MAQTHATTVLPLAKEAKAIADLWKTLHYRAKIFLDTNSDVVIDWGGSKADVINEDASGNIDGVGFTRIQLANFIDSLDNLRKIVDNEVTTKGDHLGNINQLAAAAI